VQALEEWANRKIRRFLSCFSYGNMPGAGKLNDELKNNKAKPSSEFSPN